MRALVYEKPFSLKLKESPVPEINDYEILVKVAYAGVCGTDIRIYNGSKLIPENRIIGHEFSGEIIQLGKAVVGYKIGDLVTAHPMISCNNCYACREGKRNLCVHRQTIGYELNGSFAEYVKIPALAVENGNLIKIPDSVELKHAAMAEPMSAALNGFNRTQIKSGQWLGIIGAGPIGMIHVQLAAIHGVKIVVLEPMEEKRKLAIKLGADEAIDPQRVNSQETIRFLTDGRGLDAVLLDVGIPSVLEETYRFVKKGGRYVIFAGCPENSKVTIDPNFIHYGEIELTGSSSATPKDLSEVLELMAQGKIKAEPLITAVLPLEEWQKAFEQKQNYLGLKTLLKI